MPTGAQLEFPEFTDDIIAWATKDDLNQFFKDIRVPPGTLEDYGTFKKTEAVTYTNDPDSVPSGYFDTDTNHNSFNLVVDGVPVGQVPTMQSFDELRIKYYLLDLAFTRLLERMRISGMLDEV